MYAGRELTRTGAVNNEYVLGDHDEPIDALPDSGVEINTTGASSRLRGVQLFDGFGSQRVCLLLWEAREQTF
jgi:hypothetical protein